MKIKMTGLISLFAAQFSGVGMSADLVHFWDFEGEQWWLDKAGDAHGDEPAETTTLKIEGGVGERGASMKVNSEIGGGDDQLFIAADELFQPGEEAFSMFFWIRMPDDLTTDPRGIFDFSENGGDGVQSLYIGTAGDLAFRIDFPGLDFALVRVPIELEDGEWHSVAATYDPQGQLEVHIDGFGVDGSVDALPGAVSMAGEGYLGSFNFTGTTGSKGLGGSIDDFAIFSGVLTEEEIMALSTPPDPPAKPDLEIETITVGEDGVTITWEAQENEFFSVWQSSDLVTWGEVDDSVVAGAEGGSYTLEFGGAKPERIFLQIRRWD